MELCSWGKCVDKDNLSKQCVDVCPYTSLVTTGVVFKQVRLSGHNPPNIPVNVWVPAITVATQVMLLKVTLWYPEQQSTTVILIVFCMNKNQTQSRSETHHLNHLCSIPEQCEFQRWPRCSWNHVLVGLRIKSVGGKTWLGDKLRQNTNTRYNTEYIA